MRRVGHLKLHYMQASACLGPRVGWGLLYHGLSMAPQAPNHVQHQQLLARHHCTHDGSHCMHTLCCVSIVITCRQSADTPFCDHHCGRFHIHKGCSLAGMLPAVGWCLGSHLCLMLLTSGALCMLLWPAAVAVPQCANFAAGSWTVRGSGYNCTTCSRVANTRTITCSNCVSGGEQKAGPFTFEVPCNCPSNGVLFSVDKDGNGQLTCPVNPVRVCRLQLAMPWLHRGWTLRERTTAACINSVYYKSRTH